jgi:hypothetical protein
MGDDDTKPQFTPEQVSALNTLMGATVNNILTARLATSEKKLLDKLTPTIGEALKAQLPELLKDFRPAPVDDDGKGGKGGKRDDVAMQTLQKEIRELREANQAAEQRTKASQAKLRENERQRHVNDALGKGGIADPFKQELALAYLDKKGRVTWSGEEDDASLLWNDDGGQVSFNEGLASWMKSDEAKHFLPPTGAKGAGSRPASGGALPNGGKPTQDQQWEMLGTALKERLGEL